MPYLPELDGETTAFPLATTKDFWFQVRMIERQYRRFFPGTDYFMLSKSVTATAVTPTGDRTMVGVTGTTKFDPVYGEAVDESQTTWVQNQAVTDGTVKATNKEVYFDPRVIHSRRQRIDKEVDLKLYGFDKVRTLSVFIPCSILDASGITVQRGDKFMWNNEPFKVEEFNASGYWKNVPHPLYIIINADNYRLGG